MHGVCQRVPHRKSWGLDHPSPELVVMIGAGTFSIFCVLRECLTEKFPTTVIHNVHLQVRTRVIKYDRRRERWWTCNLVSQGAGPKSGARERMRRRRHDEGGTEDKETSRIRRSKTAEIELGMSMGPQAVACTRHGWVPYPIRPAEAPVCQAPHQQLLGDSEIEQGRLPGYARIKPTILWFIYVEFRAVFQMLDDPVSHCHGVVQLQRL